MAARKSERILNLTICLLNTRRFIDRESIRGSVEGYAGLNDGAFERTFERDKDDLRAMGVPVETGSNSAFFPDEIGYRIRRQDFELPPLQVDAGEAAALGLAARTWDSATLAERTVSALAKLRAAGVELEVAPPLGLAPSVGAREESFEPLWGATITRTAVRFGYRGQSRDVEPWSMTYRRGAWYLLGFDRARSAPRMFKVARMETVAAPTGKPGGYTIPPGVDLAALAASLDPPQPDAEAVLAIRGDTAPELRRRAWGVVEVDGLAPGYTGYRVPYANRGDFASEVAAHGPDVVVVAPDDLRHRVISHLGAVIGVGS